MMGPSIVHTRQDRIYGDTDEDVGTNNFRIFTTFRLDVSDSVADTMAKLCTQDQPIPLSFHRERLIASALAFGWQHVADRLSGNAGMELLVNSVISSLSSYVSLTAFPSALKTRLTVSRECCFGVDYADLRLVCRDSGMHLPGNLSLPSINPPSCKIMLDSESTKPSLFTAHKTSVRGHYDRARERAAISRISADAKEVLLFNDKAEVMEASISTPYFFKGDRWVTPPLSSGGNSGVTRRVALESGLCVEEIVTVDGLRDGETMWISNGVRGFINGTLDLQK